MEITNHTSGTPKTKKAALRQAASTISILESKRKKAENMKQKKVQIEAKLQKLQEELEKLRVSMEKLDRDSATYEARLEYLKANFDLTEAEILDQKLQLLKSQLTEVERMKASGIRTDASEFTE